MCTDRSYYIPWKGSEMQHKKFEVVHVNSLAGFEEVINARFKVGYVLHSWQRGLSDTIVAIFVHDPRTLGLRPEDL